MVALLEQAEEVLSGVFRKHERHSVAVAGLHTIIGRSEETVARAEERVATLACVDVLAHQRRLFYVHAPASVSSAASEIATAHADLYAAVLIAVPTLFVAAVLAVVSTLVATTPLLLQVHAASNAATVAHAVSAAQPQLHVAVLFAVVVVVAVTVLSFFAVQGGVTLVTPTHYLLRGHCAADVATDVQVQQHAGVLVFFAVYVFAASSCTSSPPLGLSSRCWMSSPP